jgi:Flp pilus assembly pilin Flp
LSRQAGRQSTGSEVGPAVIQEGKYAHFDQTSKSGAVATEYAFLIAFIAIVAAIGMVLLGDNLSAFFNDIGVALDGAGSNIPDPFS